MTRNKSRVARRSRSRARRGTRKQSGGAWYNPLSWFKKPDPATGATVDAPPTTVALPPPPAPPALHALPDQQNGGRKKSRKTRHRRHRK